MKFALFALLCTLFAVAFAATAAQGRAVIVSYPDDTPDSALQSAKDAIVAAELIKAFAAKLATKNAQDVFVKVQTMAEEFKGVVEEDQMMHAQNGGF
ncbi:hypothetical protein FH972_021828 [Carpinus fangiana]|uniref:Pectinesterase inhibitor domain-containing protein n=1 Tax=Carpinus fangiana TaxID=176857 RepID=A0A5N6KR37_9ROSI|nr:hypothetical protein FH972_021828 [Carpinus fangiana]